MQHWLLKNNSLKCICLLNIYAICLLKVLKALRLFVVEPIKNVENMLPSKDTLSVNYINSNRLLKPFTKFNYYIIFIPGHITAMLVMPALWYLYQIQFDSNIQTFEEVSVVFWSPSLNLLTAINVFNVVINNRCPTFCNHSFFLGTYADFQHTAAANKLLMLLLIRPWI